MKTRCVLLLALLALLLALPSQAFALAKHYSWLQDTYGKALVSASVTVYVAGTQTKPTIYSDNGSTTKANPFTTGADGSYSFYVAPGRYDLVFAKAGYDFTSHNAAAADLPIGGATESVASMTPYAITGQGIAIIGTPANSSDYSLAVSGWNTAGTQQYYRFGRAPNFDGTVIGARRASDTTTAQARVEFWEATGALQATSLIGAGNDMSMLEINCSASYVHAFSQTSSPYCRARVGSGSQVTSSIPYLFTVVGDIGQSGTISDTSGSVFGINQGMTFTDGGTNSTTTAYGRFAQNTINFTGATRSGSYTDDWANVVATSLPTGSNYFFQRAKSGSVVWTVDLAGQMGFAGVTFANLGTPSNGMIQFCTDCTFANPCNSGGTGAFAKRLNGGWRCD